MLNCESIMTILSSGDDIISFLQLKWSEYQDNLHTNDDLVASKQGWTGDMAFVCSMYAKIVACRLKL